MTADGQSACTPAPTLNLATDRLDAGVAQALVRLVGRRDLLKAASGGVATLILAACQGAQTPTSPNPASSASVAPVTPTVALSAAGPTSGSSPTSSASSGAPTSTGLPASPVPTASPPTAAPTTAPTPTISAASPAAATSPTAPAAATTQAPLVYVFNVGSQDVTIVDPATNTVVATRPLGASIRWLSNEQRYWDGQSVWTYDYPNNQLTALAIDPKQIKVVRRIDTGTSGPAHSLMLTPDLSTALLNAAGSDLIDVIDLKSGQVTDKIATGKFP
jgi:YVTN family beta-propeller protein